MFYLRLNLSDKHFAYDAEWPYLPVEKQLFVFVGTIYMVRRVIHDYDNKTVHLDLKKTNEIIIN